MATDLPSALVDSVREGTKATFAAMCGEEPTYEGDNGNGWEVGALIGIIPFVGDFR